MKLFKNDIENITKEITNTYALEKNMIPLGFRILCRKDNRQCLSLSENFFYMSASVKALYGKIDSYCEMIETYSGELDRYNSNLKDYIQTTLCNNLIAFYGL